MVKRIIVNNDDFGITEGVSLGVIKAHRDGVLTSTTTMMNMPFAEYALDLAKDYPDLGVGIHLVFTAGRPLIDGAKSFTDEHGNFRKLSSYELSPNSQRIGLFISEADPDELYAEWKAQIEKFIAVAGKKPTHIDSHHHSHLFDNHQAVTLRLAQEYNLPIRQDNKITDRQDYVRCAPEFYGSHITPETFIDLCTNTDEETIEIMVHVGFIDQRMMEISSYNLPRALELSILCSDEIKNFIAANGIELIDYRHVAVY